MSQSRKKVKRDSLGRRTDRVKPREVRQIHTRASEGYTPEQIAKQLGRDPRTVKTQLKRPDDTRMEVKISDGYIRTETQSILDPVLASLKTQHLNELLGLATQLPQEISVPDPSDLVRDMVSLRDGHHWQVATERWYLPTEGHELFSFLRQHLEADELWARLETLRSELPGYQEKKRLLLRTIRRECIRSSYTGCPMLENENGIFPCISPLFANASYDDAVSASRTNISFEKHQYESVAHKDTIQRLFFRGRGIGLG